MGRLRPLAVGRFLVTLVGLSARDLIRVDWDELDVTGGAEPRLTCPVEGLRHGQTGSGHGRRPKREARSTRRRAS